MPCPDRASPVSGALRIAICLQELQSLRQMLNGEPVADGTYIVQGHVAKGLRAHQHKLTFLAPRNIDRMEYATDLNEPQLAPLTWSASRWFDIASKATWRVQRWLGLPYLNVFSNYRLYDACLQCLPRQDVVYERNGLYHAAVARACKRLELPYVLFFEADQILEHEYMGKPISGLLLWRAKQLLRYNLNAADCVICVSEPAKAHLIAAWNAPEEKIVVLPNGVDTKRFRPLPEERALIRAKFGMDSNPLMIFVGSFFEWHDTGTLLDSFARVLTTYPRARLVLVGDGHQREAMMRRAVEMGIGRAVTFTGLISHHDVPSLVSAADIAVAPYPMLRHDLWLSPLKLFEYMSSGTAIVASKVGQVAQVLQDECNGLLVPPGDSAAMAVAFERLIADPELRLRLGAQARADAVNKHSWERYVSRLERIFAAVIVRQPVNQI
jgi:glycosyltransferase involved in cell wall biosynthesis